jgi:hypothetical protein
MEIDRRALFASLGGAAAVSLMSSEAKAEALEAAQSDALNQAIGQTAPAADPASEFPTVAELEAQIETRHYRRGAGSLFYARAGETMTRLPAMPEAPTFMDFWRLRWSFQANHCLQSANLAQQNGMDEEVVFACLTHDLVHSLMRAHHGHWAGQLFGPYVSERVAFAIRHHAALRHYADEAFGYAYPDLYKRIFGEDFVPPAYLRAEYEEVRGHRWYDAPRLITVNDLYAFDPNVRVDIAQFEDVIGRQFRQPAEGLGADGSPVAHMWRTIAEPDAPL